MEYRVRTGFTFGNTKIYPGWKVVVTKSIKLSSITVFDLGNNKTIEGQLLTSDLEKIVKDNLETPETV